MSAIIDTNNLTKRYRDKLAVNELNLKVEQKEIFGFLGPNGAGKTTTILMLIGLTEPTAEAPPYAASTPPENHWKSRDESATCPRILVITRT